MERKSEVRCCCLDAYTGLRILGWSWLAMAAFGFWLLSQPSMKATAIVILTTYFPVFVAFTWMRCDDRTIQRKTLYDIYLVVGICVGIPLMFLSYVYLNQRWSKFTDYYCGEDETCYNNMIDNPQWAYWYGSVDTLVTLLMRGYFLTVMKAYWMEAEERDNKIDCDEHTALLN